MNDPVDIAKANYLGKLAAELMNTMLESARNETTTVPHWTDLIMAAALAMRGIAAATKENEGRPDAEVKTILAVHFTKVMMLPADAWKVVEEDGPAQAGYIPYGPKH